MLINNNINQIIKFVNCKILESEKKGINNALSSQNYFVSWIKTPGFFRLKFFLNRKKNLLSLIKINFKYLLLVSFTKDLKIFQKITNENFIYKKVIISWCTKKEFDKNDNFKDSRFNLYAKETESYLWILISLDDYIPKNIEKNIKIIKSLKKNNFLITIIKKLFEYLIENNFSIKNFFHYFSPASIFAKSFSDLVLEEYKNMEFESIMMPYEAQPFQNFIFYKLKKVNKKIKTLGYYCGLPALPTNMVFKKGAPDIIYVMGEDQKWHLSKYLLWPEERIKIINSLRFLKEENDFLKSQIFLPIALFNIEIIIKQIENFLKNRKTGELKKIQIRNHPLMHKSKLHIYLVKKINEIFVSYNSKFSEKSSKENISIFIGSSSALIDAIERDTKVYHICSDPVFQCFSNLLWPNIKIDRLSNNLFEYSLMEKGKTMKHGNKDSILNDFNEMFVL